ncbi:MAG: hypothetical protein DRG71_04105 [Deltaproteobacteria bacterium]|nr:MAG: hypothetical protein DRG71_04105 [Deltaproteobacteria bacterium]
MCSNSPFSAGNSEAGYALFAVLLISMIIMVISTAIAISVHERVRLAGEIRDRTDAYLKCHSAMNQMIYDVLTSTFTPTGLNVHGENGRSEFINLYGDPITVSEDVTVRLRDVSGMISPLFHPGYIRMLMTYVSKDTKKGNSFVDCLLDWQDRDDLKHLNGAESYEYRVAGYPYGPRNFYVQVPEEIMLVKGFEPGMFDKIKDDLAYWGTGTINFLTMSDRLLRAILRNDSVVDRIIAMRKNGVLTEKAFKDLTGIPSTERYIFGPSGWVRIEVTAKVGKAKDTLQAVIVKRETRDSPFMVTQWRS